ncbi:hypothetical protein FRC08_007377 [Ceratobasidium sp. 394]|nr:hypothetical protein FRC08_007377 [Ceratobasidium sp. 394]
MSVDQCGVSLALIIPVVVTWRTEIAQYHLMEDDLPYVPPLDATHPLLSAPGDSFDVDEFLLSRAHTSLPDLRVELNDYLGTLRSELVQLINEHYADFISLSTDLRGEGETIELMRAPLPAITAEIETSRTELREIQEAVKLKLDSRTSLREEQAILRLLLKLADSVSRVEVLLAISTSMDDVTSAGNTSPQSTTLTNSDGLGLRGIDGLRLHVTEDDGESKIRAGYAKHLSRVAAELSQVLYLAGKARDHGCAFVDSLQFRIDRTADPEAGATEGAGSDALVGLYNKVLRFIQRDVMGVVRVAESVSAKSRKGQHGPGSALGFGGMSPSGLGTSPGGFGMSPSGLNSAVMAPPGIGLGTSASANGADVLDTEDLERVEIIANVVWAELARALMDELGNVVFAVGRPDEFRQNYTTTQHLISALEALAPQASVIALRAHPLTTTFSRRWQLPVYFQLRWKDIVGKCENVLGGSTAERGDFITVEANAIYSAIQTCWSTQVYVPELGHRFWRLTLQLLSRYRTWINATLPLKDAPSAQSDRVSALATGGIPRPSTPDIAEQSSSDEASLASLGGTLADVRLLQQKVQALWANVIEVVLPDSAHVAEDDEKPEETLLRALANLGSYEKPISTQVIAILTRRCADPLSNARSIPAQYRGARRTVTAPSPFIASVWRPLSVFFTDGGPGARLRGDLGPKWCEVIFEDVVARYTSLLLKMKQAEQSLRRVKRVPTFSLFGGKSAADEERDEERIRAQMMRDVEALGDEARTLGLGLAEVTERSEGYKELKRVAALGDVEPTTPA